MRKIFYSACLILISNLVMAQGDWNTTLYYSVGIPLGNTSDYIGEVSARGFNLYADYFVEDEFSLGFHSGIQTYYEDLGKVSETTGTTTATGDQYRYLNQIPLMVTGKYHFARFADIMPHVGLGTGFMYTIQTTELGGVQLEDRDWQYTIQPEIGLGIEMSPSTDFITGVTYNLGFDSSDIDAMSSVVFHVGLRFAP